MMKQIARTIDDRLLDQTIRRVRINARRLANASGTSTFSRTLEAWKRERHLPRQDFLFRTTNPRFIGGTTGRSGTRWLVRILKAQFAGDPVVMDEIGVFVMALLREAPYEYYQFGTDNAAERREPYVDHFLRQMERYAFRRRNVYRAGMRGLVDYVPRRAIRLAGEDLRRDLRQLSGLEEITQRFGDFYLHLLNYHAAVVHGGAASWINKEPPYGRHADELMSMVPHARLIVLARDGRASALSMYKRRWMATTRECMSRWAVFSRMTADALQRCPSEQVLLLRYEDLVRDFETQLPRIHEFFGLPAPDFGRLYAIGDDSLKPQPASLDTWKREVSAADLQWFEREHGELMARLGYTR
ncbi:MAG: sulfotransferase family protein [Spirochaetaceae bacterium]